MHECEDVLLTVLQLSHVKHGAELCWLASLKTPFQCGERAYSGDFHHENALSKCEILLLSLVQEDQGSLANFFSIPAL